MLDCSHEQSPHSLHTCRYYSTKFSTGHGVYEHERRQETPAAVARRGPPGPIFSVLTLPRTASAQTTAGGDGLTISMDAVAVLFTTEIDNVVNGFALSEHVHSRVKAAGRLELTAGDVGLGERGGGGGGPHEPRGCAAFTL